jgi:hypothetical protein
MQDVEGVKNVQSFGFVKKYAKVCPANVAYALVRAVSRLVSTLF